MDLVDPCPSPVTESADACAKAATASRPSQPTFADVFSAAVLARKLPLDRLQARLAEAGVPVSVATLSYWQTGRSLPRRPTSLRAVVELEKVLGVPTGHLIASLEATADDQRDPVAILPFAEVVAQILTELELALPGPRSRTTIHDSIVIDAGRHESRQVSRRVQQADRDGGLRWPVVYRQDATERVVPVIEAVSCCRVGRVVNVPEYQLTVAEMITTRELSQGDWVMTQHQVTWAPTQTTAFRFELYAQAPLRDLVLEVRFEGEPPRSAQRYQRRRFEDPTLRDVRPVALQGNVLQLISMGAGQGVHGLTWQW